jgi:ubiquinone/menaquinone biosynthesis C-methylase UbiE
MIFCIGNKCSNFDWFSIKSAFKKYAKPDFTALEIGASTYNRTVEIARYVKKLIGVEIFKERIPDAKNEKIKYIHGDWEKLSTLIPKNSIDLALSSHVIEHVSDDLKAINELYKVLKSNGVAVINTPNRERLTRRIIELFTGKKKFPHEEHIREYTEIDLINLINKSSFKKFKIKALVLGVHAGGIYLYGKNVPQFLRQLANYWEIHLYK